MARTLGMYSQSFPFSTEALVCFPLFFLFFHYFTPNSFGNSTIYREVHMLTPETVHMAAISASLSMKTPKPEADKDKLMNFLIGTYKKPSAASQKGPKNGIKTQESD